MPLYDYKCEACEKVTEVMHGMDAPRPRKCPECGARKLKRVISCPNYHDTLSPMHPRRGRGVGGYGRVDPGEGFQMR